MFHLDRPMYLLGYLANQSRVYLIDKEFKYGNFSPFLGVMESRFDMSCIQKLDAIYCDAVLLDTHCFLA